MEGVLSNYGSGSGDGYRYGYGSGYGYGDGDGDGYGDGSGDGYGYGYGDGDGYGYGYGEKLASVGEYEVKIIRAFDVVKVGCQVHTIQEWRQNWAEVARSNSVNITQAEVDRLLSLAEAR